MKTISLFFLFTTILFTHFVALAQNTDQNYEPEILILSPSQTSADASLTKEIQLQNDSIAKKISIAEKSTNVVIEGLQGQPENIVLMTKNNLTYVKHFDFFKKAALISSSFLTYKFYEQFPNVLVLLKDTIILPEIAQFQKLAVENKMPYIINFPKIELTNKDGKKRAKISVQLYEKASNSFLLNHEYTGDDRNPGFEFACNDGSINCTISNALSVALNDIANKIAANNPTMIKQYKVSLDRANWIAENILNRPFDNTFLRAIIPTDDTSINLNNLFQCLYNAGKTQFVAFFIKTGMTNSLKSLQDKNGDLNVNIEMSGDNPNAADLDSIPKTYAYIVKGVKFNGKWYYKKDEVNYFNAPNLTDAELKYLNKLRGFDYFKENSAEPSDGFWSGSLFEKIKDRTKDPDWEKYKDMWEMEERENRDYIGLYLIVADGLKKEKQIEENIYNEKIAKEILVPFLENQIKLKLNHIAVYDIVSDHFVPIYPKDRHITLAPIKVMDENGTASVRYFVIIPSTNKIYEWTYLKLSVLKKDEFPGELVMKMMGTITHWDFSYDTLDDTSFWNNDVLLKEGSGYKYLKLLN